MKLTYFPAENRGRAYFGWLRSYHSFSFGSWYNPEMMGFGALRVLNDDEIIGGAGFDTHPHANMEIVTIPLTGALAHADSTGREAVIRAGEVQIMSAGTGIYHSEINASESEPVTLLQLWVLPKTLNIEPRYEQKEFGVEGRKNKFQIVVSPNQDDGGVWINQDSLFSLAELEPTDSIEYKVRFLDQKVFIFVIEGKVQIGEQTLSMRDAAGLEDVDVVPITVVEPSKILVIEVP